MRVVAVSVGQPREVEWQGKTVRTSIFKAPVEGRVAVSRLNLSGDEQSDLTVHGGELKAVYAYPSEHYAYWRADLPELAYPWGAFGENLTTAGLADDAVRIGDRFRIGTAEFQVTQPRMPCYKLGVRFARLDMTKRFHASGCNGFYLAVTREGVLGAGDPIERTGRDALDLTVAEVAALHAAAAPDPARLRLASTHPGLPAGWREHFRKRLA